MKDEAMLVRLAATKAGHHLEVSVSYSKGGPNYFSGGQEPRGYSLFVRPVEILPDGCKRYVLTSGMRAFIQEAKRFNSAELARLRNRAFDFPTREGGSLVKKMVDLVAAKEGLELVPVAWLDLMNQRSDELLLEAINA